MENRKSYALPIAMMFCLFAMISFVTGFQNPFGVIVKNQFGVSNFMSQLGNFANFIAYAFMGIPAPPCGPLRSVLPVCWSCSFRAWRPLSAFI